jgi:D-alanine-D-alanine ligase
MAADKVIITVTKEDAARPDVLDNRRCARSIFNALKDRYDPRIIEITKRDFKNIPALKRKIQTLSPACIFNIFEGFSDDSLKEAEFTKILGCLKIPFTGNGYRTMHTCLDKNKVRQILLKNDVSAPRGFLVKKNQRFNHSSLDFPLFIKPNLEDASVGIDSHSLVEDKNHLQKYLREKLAQFPAGVVVEEFIAGREFACGFLGNYPYEFLNTSVINYEEHSDCKPFLSYSAKWNKRTLEFRKVVPVINNRLDEALKERIIRLCRKTGNIFGCRGYFRVDLREKNGLLYVLDINPNPDINFDSGFMRQAYSKGYNFNEVILKIAKSAIARQR